MTLAGSDAVQIVDPKRNQIAGQIPVGASPHHPLFTANGGYGLVVSQGPGQLAVISPSNAKVIGTVTVGKLPHWIATSSDGDSAYVTNEGSNTVTVVDVEKQRVLATIPVGAAPRKIVVQAGPAVKSGAAPVPTPALGGTGSPGTAGSPPATPAQPAPVGPAGAIRIASFAFGPQAITVAPETAVTWTNADSIPHTSTSRDKQWDSGPIQPGASFRITLSKPGTYVYGCTIHPFMQATGVPAATHGVYRGQRGVTIAVLTFDKFPPAPKGQTYQAWVRRGQSWTSLGTARPDARGDARLIIEGPEVAVLPDALEVTREPASGSRAPSGAIVVSTPQP